ncbi:MAG: ABC transporter substrate-binding protein [Firmicutes bacterium]|nr:ABC transporter substrate-binding protein [Bacillota bacterium]
MKKKVIVILMVIALMLTALAGCEKNEPKAQEQQGMNIEEQQSTNAESATEGEDAGTEEDANSDTEVNDVAVNVVALKGPTAMGMIKLMNDAAEGTLQGYSFQLAAAPDEVAPLIIQGKVDIAAVPANLASVIYNKTEGGVQVLNINTLGVIYIIEKGEMVNSADDLRGKTIFASGQGATPEYALRFILSENGIDADNDVNIEWKSEHAECLSALIESEDGVAMLPQPFVTTAMTKAEGLRVALDLTEEWNKTQEDSENPSQFLTGVTIVRKEFAEEHPGAVKEFMEQYKSSVEFVNGNVAEAAEMIGAFDIVPAPIAEKALPACNIVFITDSDMEVALSGYLSVLAEQNPQSIGGALPGADFYYQDSQN